MTVVARQGAQRPEPPFKPPILCIGSPSNAYWILPKDVAVRIRDEVLRTTRWEWIWWPDEPMPTWVCFCTRPLKALESPTNDRARRTRIQVWLPHAVDELRAPAAAPAATVSSRARRNVTQSQHPGQGHLFDTVPDSAAPTRQETP
ncbi:hypothetical protein [Actinomadura sp. 3N407]|uniref:hypothetical protein n=1 Tax=Actinomadura sp. 3N407 TaxID=3457423 RepID=UPI003FCE9C83